MARLHSLISALIQRLIGGFVRPKPRHCLLAIRDGYFLSHVSFPSSEALTAHVEWRKANEMLPDSEYSEYFYELVVENGTLTIYSHGGLPYRPYFENEASRGEDPGFESYFPYGEDPGLESRSLPEPA